MILRGDGLEVGEDECAGVLLAVGVVPCTDGSVAGKRRDDHLGAAVAVAHLVTNLGHLSSLLREHGSACGEQFPEDGPMATVLVLAVAAH
jgi:hypothetical protein